MPMPTGIPCNPQNNSPDQGCLKYLSNENTLPAPVFMPMKCRRIHEHSGCARWIGQIGFKKLSQDSVRSKIMLCAFSLSVTAWVFIILGAFAVSNSASLIGSFGWAEANYPLGGGSSIRVEAGIWSRAAVFTSPNASQTVVGSWAECSDNYTLGGYSIYLANAVPAWFAGEVEDDPNEFCSSCAAVSQSTAMFVYLAIFTQIPQILTDLQRTTRYGDVNCQKLWGIFTSFLGMISGFQSLRTFASSCWQDLPSKYYVSAPDGTITTLNVEWAPGPGFILMLIGIIMKGIDVAIHLIVPAPVERSRPQPKPIGAVEYMRLDGQEPSGTAAPSGQVAPPV